MNADIKIEEAKFCFFDGHCPYFISRLKDRTMEKMGRMLSRIRSERKIVGPRGNCGSNLKSPDNMKYNLG